MASGEIAGNGDDSAFNLARRCLIRGDERVTAAGPIRFKKISSAKRVQHAPFDSSLRALSCSASLCATARRGRGGHCLDERALCESWMPAEEDERL